MNAVDIIMGTPTRVWLYLLRLLCVLDSFGAAFLEFRVVTRRGGAGRERRDSRTRTSIRGGLGDKGSGVIGGVGPNGGAGDDHSYAVVWRRFTAFRSLHFDIVNMLRGSHLLDSLPPLPGKSTPPPPGL